MFFVLTSEVSVVGAHMSLTLGYHGPSADLLYPGVCERHEPPGPNSNARLRMPFSLLPRYSVQRGLDVIRKEAWSFTEQVPVSAYVGSSKNLKDLNEYLTQEKTPTT